MKKSGIENNTIPNRLRIARLNTPYWETFLYIQTVVDLNTKPRKQWEYDILYLKNITNCST